MHQIVFRCDCLKSKVGQKTSFFQSFPASRMSSLKAWPTVSFSRISSPDRMYILWYQ